MLLVTRMRSQDATTMASMQAVQLVTLGGARALGLEREIDSVEVGKRADLVVLDYRASASRPP